MSALVTIGLGIDGWPAILWGGHVESHGPELRTQLVAAIQRGALIAIEHLQGYAYEANRVAQLIETGHAEGRILERTLAIIEAARPAGRVSKVREITASDWRGALCRTERASDEQIRLVVEGLCKVRPVVKADARPHIWDAAGLAIVALARENGRAIHLPPAVSAALHVKQQEEKADRADKKARGTVTALQKRFPTRKQSERRSAAAKAASAARKAGA